MLQRSRLRALGQGWSGIEAVVRHEVISGRPLGDRTVGFSGRDTYKVGLGGLVELLLCVLADVGIWDTVSRGCIAPRPWGEGDAPAERVPSNTWLMSMIAGGRLETCGGLSLSEKKGCEAACVLVQGVVPRGRRSVWKLRWACV